MPDRNEQWHRDTGTPFRFARVPNLTLGFLNSQDDGGLDLPPSTIASALPDWATAELCSRILRTIDRFRYARFNTNELRVFVPEVWISERDRRRGMARGGTIFDVRIEMYPGRQVIVGHYLEVT